MSADESYSVKEYITRAVEPRLASIERKLDELLREGTVEAREAMMLGRTNALDIGRLIAWRNRIVGALSVISLVSGMAFAIVVKHFGI